MIITMHSSLSCASPRDEEATTPQHGLCGEATTIAILSAIGDGAWELLPVCQHHWDEAKTEWQPGKQGELVLIQ